MNDPADNNPYAPPTAAVNAPAPPAVAFIQKNSLVVPVGWQSPPVCILTGKTVDLLPRRKTFFWTNPWIVPLVSAFLLYQIFNNNEIGCIFLLISSLLLFIFRRKDFVDFYINKSAAKIYTLKQLIYWAAATVFIFSLYAGYSKNPYGIVIFMTGMAALSLIQRWSFHIANIHWKRLWLGGVPHQVMKTIVRMDEEKAASQEVQFPAPRFNFKS